MPNTVEFPTIDRPVRSDSSVSGAWRRKRPTRFELWAWSPIMSFRLGLTTGYLAMIYFGVSALFASVPAFELTAPEGWSAWWAVALVLGAGLASVGSVSQIKLFERLELTGSAIITVSVGSYATLLLVIAYVLGDASRATVGAGFVALTAPVLVRTLWLFSQLLRK